MLYSIIGSPFERESVAGLQPNFPVIFLSRINLYIYIYTKTHTHIVTECEFFS